MDQTEREAAQRLAVTVLRLCPDAEEITLDDEVVMTRDEVNRD